MGQPAGRRQARIRRFLAHPADLSHALPRPTFRAHAGRDSRRGNRSGGLGDPDRGIGAERREHRSAVDGARGYPGAQRLGGVHHPGSVRRLAAAREAGARCGRPRHLRLPRGRPDHGCDELLHVRRPGRRNRRPSGTAVASVAPGTLPCAGGAQMRKLKIIEHVSLDGVISPGGPGEYGDDYANGGWTAPYRSPAGAAAVVEAQGTGFDLLLGRRTYDLWAGFWPKVKGGPFADGLNAATKYVATHRPESLGWGPVGDLGTDVMAGGCRGQVTDRPDPVVLGRLA